VVVDRGIPHTVLGPHEGSGAEVIILRLIILGIGRGRIECEAGEESLDGSHDAVVAA
jgi:hypothetical protein